MKSDKELTADIEDLLSDKHEQKQPHTIGKLCVSENKRRDLYDLLDTVWSNLSDEIIQIGSGQLVKDIKAALAVGPDWLDGEQGK